MGLPRWLGWAIRLAGLLILPLLIWRGVDAGATVEIVRQANGALVLVALAFAFTGVLLRVWRWRIVARACGLHYTKYLDYLRLYSTGLFAGAVVPQAAAAFAPVVFISTEGRPWRRAAVSIILDRSLELALLLGFALWGVFYLLPMSSAASLAVVSAAGTVTLGAGGAFALGCAQRHRRVNTSRLRRLASRFASLAELEQWASTAKALTSRLGPLALASLAILALQVLVATSLAGALDLDVSPAFLVATYSLVLLATTLPISVLGLGPREGVLVAVLTASSVTSEEAMALGILLSMVAIATRLPGIVPWFWHWRASTSSPSASQSDVQLRRRAA